MVPMTVEQFYRYADRRPEIKKMDLVAGVPVVNAAPSEIHAQIVGNLHFELSKRQRQIDAEWTVLPDIGILVSGHDRLEPDLAVVPDGPRPTRDRSDPIVVFEVLSRSTQKDDLGRKREAYTGVASVTHYVVIAQDAVKVIVFARDDGFRKRTFRSRNKIIEFPPLRASLRIEEIYYRTGL